MSKRIQTRRRQTARLLAWLDSGRKPANRRVESARRFLDLAFGG